MADERNTEDLTEADEWLKDGAVSASTKAARDEEDGLKYLFKRSRQKTKITAANTDASGDKQVQTTPNYTDSHGKRGLAVIISNEKFESENKTRGECLSDRESSEKDLEASKNTFEKLGFNVWTEKDLRASQMVGFLIEAMKKYPHAEADCFVCMILSHGNRRKDSTKENEIDVIYGVDRVGLTVEAIISIFSGENCSELKDKPRLFFFEACRGEKLDDGVVMKPNPFVLRRATPTSNRNVDRADPLPCGIDAEPESEEPKMDLHMKSTAPNDDNTNHQEQNTKTLEPQIHKQEQETEVIPFGPFEFRKLVGPSIFEQAVLYPDCLIMYSSPPGYASYLRDNDGSWFIQSLCKVLDHENYRNLSLTTQLTCVCNLVAMNYEH